MARYHVKSDGAMGPCTAQEGHCPFGGDSGTKHFTSITEARAYAEELIKNTNKGGMKMKKTSSPKVWPPTEHGCHSATYSGWECDDVIISAGGYVNGVYVPASEVWGLAGLWDRLSDDVGAEMPMADGDPAEWNDRILELKQKGVSDEDAELLDALWVSGEVCEGEVTIYGRDDSVTKMDEDDLYEMGLTRVATDDDDEDEESPTSVTADDDDEPRMTTNMWGLKVTTWPPTEKGVYSATYLGWKGYDEIINAGGWIAGEYISPTDEPGLNRAWKRLPEDVKDELEEYAGGDPAEWNGRILELKQSGALSPEDEELLDAFWIEGESFNGSVTIYGTDDVSGLDEDDFRLLGLNRMTADELWRYGVLVDDDDDDDEDE